jgi:hypothetical protein
MLMLRSAAIFFGLSCLLLALGWLMTAPVEGWASAPMWVAIGVGMAVLLYGELSFLPVVAGALSPLLPRLVGGSLAWGLFAMSVAWLSPRFVLARTRDQLAIVVLGSIGVAAAVARVVSGDFLGEPSWRVAACLFAAASLTLATTLLPGDTAVAHALCAAARAIGGSLAGDLERAAQHHRQLPHNAPWSRAAWRRLLVLADRRAAMRKLTGSDADTARAELDLEIREAIGDLLPEPPAAPGASAEPGPERAPAGEEPTETGEPKEASVIEGPPEAAESH